MTLDLIVVLGLVAVAVALFVTEKLPVDLVALLIMGVLMLSGILTAAEGLRGFSNEATVTVAAMFVLGAAVSQPDQVDPPPPREGDLFLGGEPPADKAIVVGSEGGAISGVTMRFGAFGSSGAEDAARPVRYVLVSKDEDFHRLSVLFGAPPKVISIRLGNCSTDDVLRLLRASHDVIGAFLQHEEAAFLALA